MILSGDKANSGNCDLIELKSEPARLDAKNIFEYLVIHTWVDGRLMNTEIYAHITQLKLLERYKGFTTTPIVLLNIPMGFFEEWGYVTVQKLTAIWEIKEVKVDI